MLCFQKHLEPGSIWHQPYPFAFTVHARFDRDFDPNVYFTYNPTATFYESSSLTRMKLDDLGLNILNLLYVAFCRLVTCDGLLNLSHMTLGGLCYVL